jgi:hypothetical protein
VALFASMRLLRSGAPLPLPSEAAAGFWQRLPIRILPAELRSSSADLFAFWGLPLLALALAAAARALRRPPPAILVLTCAGWLAVLFASPLVTWHPPGGTA